MIEMVCGGGCLTGTSCIVTGLQPATTYVIRVTAHNGMSDQDAGGTLARQKQITLMTAIAREFIATRNIILTFFTCIKLMGSLRLPEQGHETIIICWPCKCAAQGQIYVTVHAKRYHNRQNISITLVHL